MAEMKAASTRGKKFNQKLKPYVVLQYRLKYSDENHIVTAPEIVAFLQEHDIEAERRSIYRDIKEINKVALMMEEVGDRCKIKGSGCIRTREHFLQLIDMGVKRIGSTASITIVEAFKEKYGA